MKPKRQKRSRLRNAAQLRALASPASLEIIEALQSGGPATVSELGPRMGRRANSLHYHVRKLTDVGLVRKVGARRSGARTEAIHDVTAQCFVGKAAPESPELQKLTNDAVASILRMANRNFDRATRLPGIVESGKARNIMARRSKAWLTRDSLAEVNGHLDAVAKILAENNGTGRGRLCALTLVLTPLDPERSASS